MPTTVKRSKCLHDIIYPNSKYDLLTVDPKKRLEMYDMDFTPYLETLSHSGARYVSWSYVKYLTVQHFPNLDYSFEKCPKTGSIYHIDQTVFSLPEGQRLKTISWFDKKTKTMQREEVFDVAPYLLPFIYDTKTFARTEAIYFPIMLTGNKPCYGLPDNMTLNKNQQRAKVKIAGEYLMIGWRCWTGQDFDSEKPNMLLRLRQLNDEFVAKHGVTHEEYRKVHFGLSTDQLISIGKQMKQDVASGSISVVKETIDV